LSTLDATVSVSQHGPAVLRPAFQRLDDLSKLEHDWDTYGALPLTANALELAETTMRKVVKALGKSLPERVAPYTVMPIADGGVSIEWRGPMADLELDIGPSGALSYLIIERVDEDRRFEEGSEISEQQALDLVRRVIGG
jgi:hypothetical protein